MMTDPRRSRLMAAPGVGQRGVTVAVGAAVVEARAATAEAVKAAALEAVKAVQEGATEAQVEMEVAQGGS